MARKSTPLKAACNFEICSGFDFCGSTNQGGLSIGSGVTTAIDTPAKAVSSPLSFRLLRLDLGSLRCWSTLSPWAQCRASYVMIIGTEP